MALRWSVSMKMRATHRLISPTVDYWLINYLFRRISEWNNTGTKWKTPSRQCYYLASSRWNSSTDNPVYIRFFNLSRKKLTCCNWNKNWACKKMMENKTMKLNKLSSVWNLLSGVFIMVYPCWAIHTTC